MVKKGLSLDEKRARVLEIFHNQDEVFQLKEIEKEAVKKGVTLQSVKEVVQSLVDDDLVHQEKIGISNFLWSFAAEASTKAKRDEQLAEAALALVRKDYEYARAELEAERQKCSDSNAKQAAQLEIAELQSRISALKDEKAALAIVDPERFEALKEAATVARDSANRWLDNIHSLKEWTGKRFQGRDREVEQFFAEKGLTEKMDYLD